MVEDGEVLCDELGPECNVVLRSRIIEKCRSITFLDVHKKCFERCLSQVSKRMKELLFISNVIFKRVDEQARIGRR